MRARHAIGLAAISTLLVACGNNGELRPAPTPVTVTSTVSKAPTTASPETTGPTPATRKRTRVERQVAQAQKLNKRHRNDGRYTYIVDKQDRVYGLIAVKVSQCQAVADMRHGCFMSGFVNVKALVDGLTVNPADFYLLDRDNRRYIQGAGESLFVPINGERLALSSLNRNEVLTGVVTFDAPAHGRLIYDPTYADARVTWVF